MIIRTRDKQTQKGSPQQATKPPTLHVDGLDRQHGPQHAYSARSHNRRTYSTRMAAYPRAALPAGCSRPMRTSPARGRPRRRCRCAHSAATRRLATARPPRRTLATTPRRAPRRRRRPARRPPSRPPRASCGCTAYSYLRSNERRSGHPQLTARGVWPTARRR